MPRLDSEDDKVHQEVNRLAVHGITDAPDIYIGYLPSFRAHLRDTRAHLAGSIPFYDTPNPIPSTKSTPPPHAKEDNLPSSPEQVEDDPELPLLPRKSKSTIWSSSLSSWSQIELDAFFHALSIYSRWRPDLIAEAVKTKGEVEIVEFLITLNSCARSGATGTSDMISAAPAATEVSDEWVVAEEAMAAALAVEDNHGELQELEAFRRKRVRDAKADMIPRGKRRRVTVEVGEDEDSERDYFEDESMSVEVVKGKARFDKWHARKIAAWERDDMLRKLEDTHLQVLDAMLREDEEAQRGKSLSREGSADVVPQDLDTKMDVTALTPTSRRRHTKRLYMRRKRAQLRGEDVVPMTLARMKPGRKGKERAAQVVEETEKEGVLPSGQDIGNRTTMTPNLTQPDSEADDDDVGNAGKATTKKHINVGGKTRYQKVKSDFENAGINASYLGEHGMDLFHLGHLGKLIGMYKSLEQRPEDDVGTTFISPELIRYLQALVVAFTTDVIHRATVWKEQANELKGQKKVWRGALHQINQPAVQHALMAIGARSSSQQEHFSKLLDQYDLSPDKRKRKPKSSTPADMEDERTSPVGHSPNADSHDIALSPHRAIYTPALLAPASFDISVVDTFFPDYDRQFPSKALINEDSRDAVESLLSDETDLEALDAELVEDEILDQVDMEAGKKVEEQLWAEVEREEPEGDDASVTSEQ